MVTYAQLEAESWWDREITTPELKQFEAWLRKHFGLRTDATGDKGNNVHLNGSHRSQEWIERSQYCTNHTYTVQQGLTADQKRHIAGCDITPKTRADMLALSQRIDRATRAGQLEEIVYWYGNTNGDQRVDGYDNIRNALATSDSSHLWHLHLSFDRRVLRDLAVMRRVFAVLTGTTPPPAATTEDDMNNYFKDVAGQPADVSRLSQGNPGYAGQQRDTAIAFTWQAAHDAAVAAQEALALLKTVAAKTGVTPDELAAVQAAAKTGAAEAFAEQRDAFVAQVVAALPQDKDGNLSVADVRAAVVDVLLHGAS